MTENWAAVAQAINERMQQLGLRQRDVAERSQVSQAIVREIQNQTVERRRSARTLEALALALDWHPQHLLAVLQGRRPPTVGEPREDMDDAVSARLAHIEDHGADTVKRLDAIEARISNLTEELAALRVAMTETRAGRPRGG